MPERFLESGQKLRLAGRDARLYARIGRRFVEVDNHPNLHYSFVCPGLWVVCQIDEGTSTTQHISTLEISRLGEVPRLLIERASLAALPWLIQPILRRHIEQFLDELRLKNIARQPDARLIAQQITDEMAALAARSKADLSGHELLEAALERREYHYPQLPDKTRPKPKSRPR